MVKTDPDFDPKAHTLSDSNYFEDLEIGQRFVIPSRTLGDANFAAFQLASGDNHPVYCGDTVYPALEIVGLKPGKITRVITLRSTVHNQRRELVMEGEQKMLVRKRPAL